ncbi:MAG: Unknown protein [uncultured Sulfurovum sp.]|uniref:Uncharacterized protein n=1 Tax=uncultured Sulfurovum sp. TaxID=269237 RepID=A0A6S6TIJ4_9BACT|nr:MAG: Unknown protein [uncultured Sulfurovum sp.]
MIKSSLILNKPVFFLRIIFLIYVLGIITKKFLSFQDGFIDIFILTVFFILLIFRPQKLLEGINSLLSKKFFILFILFTIYFILLSFSSFNTLFLIVLEYLSVLKWLIYFFIGYLFAYVYPMNNIVFPANVDLTLFTFFVLLYSLLFYNWSGIGGISTLFGFYENSYASIFSLRSVFAIFGLIVFIYTLNSNKGINIFLLFSSFVFLFMSGNRKMLIVFLAIIFFLNLQGKYKIVLKIFRWFVTIVLLVVLTQTVLFQNSIKEYSTVQQPRLYTYLNGFKIAKDYFPIGSGPATFASKGSMINYSPIYQKYGMDQRWGFRPDDDKHFYNDTYWAQVIGQYGFTGTILLLLIYFSIMKALPSTTMLLNNHTILILLLFVSFVTPSLQRIEVALFIFFLFGIQASIFNNSKKALK